MRGVGKSEELTSIPWLFSAMAFCSDSHRWRRTRKIMFCLCLTETEAVGLRVAGTCGINNVSLSSSLCNAAILCCVKRKLWQGVILLPPSLPCTFSPCCSGDDEYLSFLLCQPALCSNSPCRLTSAAVLPLLWENKRKKPYWRHCYPTLKMCLCSHPYSDPSTPGSHTVSISRRCTD